MTHARTRLLGAGLTAALTAGTLLAAPPAAHAAPVFAEAYSDANQGRGSYGSCTDQSPDFESYPDTDLAENGTVTTNNVTTTAKHAATGDATDVITNTATYQAGSSVTAAGGTPRSMQLRFTGTVSATSTKATSACSTYSEAGSSLYFRFTLTSPLWATITTTNKGPAYVEADISEDDADPQQVTYGRELDGTGTRTILLPPGTYRGELEGQVRKTTNRSYTGAASGSVTITFAQPGSASQAPTGKAGKYVTLPDARTCATHTATATLTTKKKLAKHIDKVTFTVNGKKAATLKGKKVKKGKAVVLPLADNTAADITATVVLDNGKKKTVDAGYLACTS